MRVQISNERILPRFGVDRILLLLASRLKADGHDISLSFLRADAKVWAVTERCLKIEVPGGLDLIEMDAFASGALCDSWTTSRPDVLVVGGWPFFGTTALAPRFGITSVFIDAGAVPHDLLSEDGRRRQQQVVALRQKWLPSATKILPISQFIAETQTYYDRGSSVGVETVLLGGDALVSDYHAEDESTAVESDVAEVEAVIAGLSGAPIILSLGRFEAEGYKNSREAFAYMRRLLVLRPDAVLLILVGENLVDLPADLASHVVQLGTLSDKALESVMMASRFGVCFSLWEGFNLPIVEMQRLDRPALVYNRGAHSEVIAHPWFLCANLDDLVAKSATLLNRGMPEFIPNDVLERSCRNLRWETTLSRWSRAILDRPQVSEPSERLIIVDVTNSSIDPANSGVIRVTRRLSAALEAMKDLNVVFVRWDQQDNTFRLLTRDHARFLSSNAGPVDWLQRSLSAVGSVRSLDDILADYPQSEHNKHVLLIAEVVLDGSAVRRVEFGRKRGFKIVALLYDLLPIYYRELTSDAVAMLFPAYLSAVGMADQVIAISKFSLDQFDRYAGETDNIGCDVETSTIWLPGQFGKAPRGIARSVADRVGEEVRVLFISTIEPRKNHANVIDAFKKLWSKYPDASISLVLVGNAYLGSENIVEKIQTLLHEEPRIVWRGAINDDEIVREFDAADFTIYGSLAEGFGLPILESLWMGRPCICNNSGVMAELAADGGCLTVDMTSPDDIADGVERLMFENGLLKRLAKEANERHISTWEEYASAFRLAALS